MLMQLPGKSRKLHISLNCCVSALPDFNVLKYLTTILICTVSACVIFSYLVFACMTTVNFSACKYKVTN